MVEDAVWKAIRAGEPLPEELADLFTLMVREVNGELRAFLEFA